jgi:putative ABC transport system ATP-binding protein
VRLARERRTAVVLVTHDGKVAAYADREVVIRDGMVDPTGLGIAPASRADGAARTVGA